MAFLDNNYLITNAAGKLIFEKIKDLPVIDPHNHANVKEIADNGHYADAWQLFAATDHYVWEMLRKREVPEELITSTFSGPVSNACGRKASVASFALTSCQIFSPLASQSRSSMPK